MPAPHPLQEAERLEALGRYHILDTPPEQDFDDLVRLAAAICGTPIALVTLVDANRQWFKANLGLPFNETPRDLAFCAHTINQPGILLIPDLLADERFADNPFVIGDDGARFYAGMPLTTPEGHNLGTLCVIDRVPRTLTPEQLEALRILGRQVITQLELRRRVRELEHAEAARHHLEELQHIADLTTVVMDTISNPVLVVDRQGTVLRLNQAAEQVTGYTLDELQEGPIWDRLLRPEDAAMVRWAYEHLDELSFPATAEHVWLTRSGLRTLKLTSNLLRDEQGAVIAMVTAGSDITDLRQSDSALRTSEARMRTLLSTAPLVLYMLDNEGRFTLSDGSGLASIGLKPNQVVGLSVFDLYHDNPESLANLRAVLAGEERNWRDHVAGRVFEVHAVPFYDEQQHQIGAIGVSQDVTERARAEQERSQLQEQVIAAQAAALAELSTPLIPISERIVVMPLIGAVDSQRAQQVLGTLLNGVAERRAQVAILDITGVPVVDTQVANALLQAAQAATLLGTRVVLTGIRPEIAQTLVGLGVDLRVVVTRGTLQAGIQYAMELQGDTTRTRL
ncbi:MAG: hypothetical protein OHK0022_55500 [Roseiflexaceae bacterium]